MACSETESFTVRQDEELLSIKAIYEKDVQDLREKDAWKVPRPPEVQITLRPHTSMTSTDKHVTIDLYVKCPANYPEAVPEIKLVNAKGLSNSLIAQLQQSVEAIAKENVGEVMLFILCAQIEDFLSEHNKPISTMSFYDEMISNQKKHEEKDQQMQKEKNKRIEEKKIKEIAELLQKRNREEAEQLEQLSSSEATTMSALISPPAGGGGEKKRLSGASGTPPPETPSPCKFEKRKSPLDDELPARGRTSTPIRQRYTSEGAGSVGSGPGACEQHRGTAILTFPTKGRAERNVQRGNCLGHSGRRKGRVVYAGLDTESGELVAVVEWLIQWRSGAKKLNNDLKREDDKQAASFMKSLSGCETELNSLVKLHHPHLVHYYALSSQQQVGRITVNVLTEYVGGGNLQHYAESEGEEKIPLAMLREYTCQILDALAFLHSRAMVHKDIRPSSLMLDSDGKIRLANYGLDKRLSELVAAACNGNEESDAYQVLGRGGKKCDIYQLGLTLLSLLEGKQVRGLMPELPHWLPPVLCDFLRFCLLSDERERWSASQLQQHSFLTMPLPVSPHQRLHQHKDDSSDDDDDEPKRVKPRRRRQDTEEAGDPDDIPYIPASNSGSRLQNEFQVLKYIGKGGFGDVIKVRNKLDGRLYAIKRIPLNPRKSAFKKKITREVKLLSRLNHENVVRYYNSWIETSSEPAQSDNSTFAETDSRCSVITPGSVAPPSPPKAPAPAPAPPRPQDSSILGGLGVASMEAPSLCPGDDDDSWGGMSGEMNDGESSSSSSEDDEEEEEVEDVFGGCSFIRFADSDSEGIVFEGGDEDDMDNESETQTNKAKANAAQQNVASSEAAEATEAKLQFLYIQMEFCEKSTLRHCIDDSLYLDMDRVWRLFREIIEGLVHIHEQGMIHRDLKPVNIFLDSNDHVKIGDFGLATSDIISKQQSGLLDLTMVVQQQQQQQLSTGSGGVDSSRDDQHGGLGGSSLTGKIGTVHYVSPEINNAQTRSRYNQKVDLYSLGVIFFEMCYRPLNTGMERAEKLTKLRSPSIELPADFDVIEMANQVAILKWLLNHDPAKRPTSQELLKSDYLPPPQREEEELNEVLRSTISNPESRSYKHMIKAIYNQQVGEAVDFAYDTDLEKSIRLVTGRELERELALERWVTDTVEWVFRRHGAQRIHTPLLIPRSPLYTSATSASHVCFMDQSGGLVSLPYDLRVPFARWVARSGVVGPLKRYTLQPMYRPDHRRAANSHPREIRACSFDIVAAGPAMLVVDAECIHVVHQIVQKFPGLKGREYYLRLNHSSLLQGVLTYCGVPENLHAQVCTILGDTKIEQRKKLQVQTKLITLSLSEHTVTLLYKFLEMEESFSQLSAQLKAITKKKDEAGCLTKKGLAEIEAVLGYMECLGVSLRPVLALGMLTDPPAAAAQHYSGIIFQVVCDVRRRKEKKVVPDVLAAGGRYDALVSHFRHPGMRPPSQQSVVGVTLSLEKIRKAEAAAADSDPYYRGELTPGREAGAGREHYVLLHSHGPKAMIREKLQLARMLWDEDMAANIHHDDSAGSADDIVKQYEGVTCLVTLREGDDKLRVTSYPDGKIRDKKLKRPELMEFLKTNTTKLESTEVVSSQHHHHHQQSSSSSFPPITFIIPDDSKMSKNRKRSCTNQIYQRKTLPLYPNKKIEILALELTSQVLKTIIGNLDLGSQDAFTKSIKLIMERHQQLRNYLNKVFDHIFDEKFEKKKSIFVLYGLKDESLQVLFDPLS